MKKITAWSIIKKDGSINHNHIEDGWSHHEKPQPIRQEFANQLAWQNLDWKHEHGYLDNEKVMRV